MRARLLAIVLAGALLPIAGQAAAQAVLDEPQVVFNVGGGFYSGRSLWAVDGQPFSVGDTAGLLDLTRRFNSGFNAYLNAAYFPTPNIGISGEFAFIDLGTRVHCTHRTAPGFPGTDNSRNTCTTFDGADFGGSAVLISLGPVFRPWSRGRVAPFFEARGGFTVGAASTVEMSRTVVIFTPEDTMTHTPADTISTIIRIYDDHRGRQLTPGFLLAAGISARLGSGYLLTLQIRDNIVRVREVTGTAGLTEAEPPSRAVFRHIPVVAIGFGVVLQRRPGRRY